MKIDFVLLAISLVFICSGSILAAPIAKKGFNNKELWPVIIGFIVIAFAIELFIWGLGL